MEAQQHTTAKQTGASTQARAPAASPLFQRKCACGGSPGVSGECEDCQENRLQRQASSGAPSNFSISQPNDALEKEADRIADAVMNDGVVSAMSASSAGQLQRQTPSEPGRLPPDSKFPPEPGPSEEEKYKEAAKKIADALRQTKAGKDLEAQAKQLGEKFLDSVEGKVITGAAIAGAVAAAIGTNADLPDLPIPEIPLDFIKSGLKAKLTWEGPARGPKSASLTLTAKSGVKLSADYKRTEAKEGKPGEERAGLTLTIPLGGSSSKKPGPSESEKFRAETARMRADQEKFREGLKTPAERAQDTAFWDMYWKSKSRDPLGLPSLRSQPRTETKKEKKEEETLSRKAGGSGLAASATLAPPAVRDVLNSPGQPLDGATRSFFEARFGHDFGHVRVHTDSRAAESARSVRALAYTVGRDVVFGAGQFQPGLTTGRQLLAHELTHVLQQEATVSRVRSPSREIGPLPMGQTIKRKAAFVDGKVTEEFNLADRFVSGEDAGKTDFVLNGSMFTTVAGGRNALQVPQVGSAMSGKNVRCWIDSVPENNASYSMKVLKPGPWSLTTTKGKMNGLFPTLKACGKDPKAGAVFNLKGDPADEDQRKRTRKHEDRHAEDYKSIFTDVIEPWDRKLTLAQSNKRVVAGADRDNCETILYKSQVGNKQAPDELVATIINRVNSMGKNFHASEEGRMVIVSKPTSDKDCNSVIAEAR